MLQDQMRSGLLRALQRHADSQTYPLVVAGVALAATVSMTVPFASLLVASVLFARPRWHSIATWSSAGAATGALALYLVFHHLGWNRVFAAYPDLVRSMAWRDATEWLTQYGVTSLLLLAALPVPLTPALVFAAISRLPVVEVIAALWLGKWVKYMVYAWLTSRFPDRLLRRGWQRVEAVQFLLAAAGSPLSNAPSVRKDER